MAEKKGKGGAGTERPESPKVPVLSIQNEAVREIQLSPTVFAGQVNGHLIYEAVKQYRAGGRRGTHMTKNRALVSGSGRKPWRQKGTGRARAGSRRCIKASQPAKKACALAGLASRGRTSATSS